jgi:shikimate dehydrogenase
VAEEAAFDPDGKTAVVLGAGGAARAVAVALAQAGASVRVSARRAEQASEVAALAAGIDVAPWGEPMPADIVVNATPTREGLPLGSLGFGPGMLAVDLIYLPPMTEFVRFAREAGATALDGLGMLVHQAALSFRLWTGIDPPLAVMAEAARATLSSSEAPDPS